MYDFEIFHKYKHKSETKFRHMRMVEGLKFWRHNMRRNKSKYVLDYFINNYPQSLSIKKISDKFGVSERQIKNYIKQINENNSQKDFILQIFQLTWL